MFCLVWSTYVKFTESSSGPTVAITRGRRGVVIKNSNKCMLIFIYGNELLYSDKFLPVGIVISVDGLPQRIFELPFVPRCNNKYYKIIL
jgi:hypothetical protein